MLFVTIIESLFLEHALYKFEFYSYVFQFKSNTSSLYFNLQTKIIMLLLILIYFISSISTGTFPDHNKRCEFIPKHCRSPTIEYNSLNIYTSFNGIAYWSERISYDPVSCDINVQNVSEYVVGLPFPFMFMSRLSDECDTSCNYLCGQKIHITNTATGKSLYAKVVDTAATESMAIVLSKAAFTALGANLGDGVIKDVEFHLGRVGTDRMGLDVAIPIK